MNILDWILIGWIVAAFFVGARLGLVYHVGSLLGLFIGIEIASWVHDYMTVQIGASALVQFAVFTVVVIGVAVLCGLVAKFLDKIFKFVSWIPFAKTLNRLGGAIIAMVVDILFTGVVLYFLTQVEISDVLNQTIAESVTAQFLSQVGFWVTVLLPGIVF